MIVQLDRLQVWINNIGLAPSWLRDTFFSVAEYYPNGEVNIEIVKQGLQVAPFVAPEIGGQVMERLGRKVGTFTPPEIAPQRVITTKNLLAAAGNSEVTFIERDSTPESRQIRLVREDFDDLEKSITRREELMCSEALFKGQVTVKGKGYQTQVIHFWDQADKPYLELSGAAQWSNLTTADPIADIEVGIQKVQERSGITPTDVIMSPKTWAYARRNDRVILELDVKGLDIGEIYGANKANRMGVRLVGRLAGVNIWTYSQTLLPQENGVTVKTQVVPDDLILFASTDVPTEMAYGVVTITDVKAQTMRHSTGRRVVNQYLNNKNPAGIVNEMKCAPLPIPKIPDGFFVMKVAGE